MKPDLLFKTVVFSLFLLLLTIPISFINAQDVTPVPQTVSDFVNLARLDLENGRIQDAMQNAGQAINLDSSSADAFYLRGRAYYEQGSSFDQGWYQDAINDLSQAIALNPQLTDAYYYRGLAYNIVGTYEQVIEDVNHVLELAPRYVDAYYLRGKANFAHESYDDVIQDMTHLLTIDPQYAKAYYLRGSAYEFKGDSEAVVVDETRAIELDPTLAHAYYRRGRNYSRLGMYQEAIDDETRAMELYAPLEDGYYDGGRAYYERAVAYLGLGSNNDLAKAQADFKVTVDIFFDDPWPNMGLGDIARNLGNIDEAIEYYTQAISISPELADAYLARATARYSQIDLSRGIDNIVLSDADVQAIIDDYTSAILYNDQFASAYYRRGLLYLYQKKYDLALDDITTACKLYGSEDCALDLGDVYLHLDEPDQAMAAYNDRLIEGKGFYLHASTTEVYRRRAALELQQGDFTQAYSDLQAAIAREPYWYSVYATLGDYYTLLGSEVEALIAYHQYLDLARDQARPEVVGQAQTLEATLKATFPSGKGNKGCFAVVLTTSFPDVYEIPEPEITPSTNLAQGDPVKIVSQKFRWYQVELPDGSTGWIFKPYVLTPEGADCARILDKQP